MANANANNGRAVFAKTCMVCQRSSAPEKIGPDITGSNRGDLNYVLENVVDPSAIVGKDYLMVTFKTRDGPRDRRDHQGGDARHADDRHDQRADDAPQARDQEPDDQQHLDDARGAAPRDARARRPRPDRLPAEPWPVADARHGGKRAALLQRRDLVVLGGGPGAVARRERGAGRQDGRAEENNFIFSQMLLRDFRLVVHVKLTPDKANSGIQFRSQPRRRGGDRLPGRHRGRLVGKIYEENGRGLLTKEGGEKFVKPDDWNTYEVLAVGDERRLAINGQVCSEITDPAVAKQGQTGLQLHAGGPTEVHYKDFKLEGQPEGRDADGREMKDGHGTDAQL